ncbi:aldehyde ferredoxin oxidoreductase family protein [Syntrophomonas wolfei]|uniref:Aldehyde ferredoxin oxidoreductase n=2 Tax=Syntrophomonas wolfei TaxID=863 RepID=Q0AWA3_SYNWW|nr:aldehyde ferredoxin oxidoreductase family protein [Syntrophomonas wolfei]ABI69001.1 Aldehyde ferredoxin oxidoreductase [Syntrophomonas wolfei subsp. wolfei str. Goettingen G311]
MYAWIGQILRVNLTDATIKKEKLDPALLRNYIGARGLGSKLFMDEVNPQVDPLSPENKIIFMTGPLTGTLAASGGRYNVVTRGPLNGTIAASNSGGSFGPELKYAGYDGIIFEGKAEKPVYLWINNAEVELRSAEELWGRNVPETTDMIKQATHEEAKVACIGPAGEKLVKFACIMNEYNRAAGRSGVGAVMGSKNLKALAVRGTGGIKVADRQGFMQAITDARNKLKAHPVTGAGLAAYGTNVLVNILNEHGGLPVKNFSEAAVFAKAENVSGEYQAEHCLVRNKGCFGCSIGCGRVSRNRGKYKGIGEGPEYEATWGLGPNLYIDDFEAISKANFLCNELGLDPISLAGTLACATEMMEKGFIPQEKAELCWGDADMLVEMTIKTAYREGFGDELAEGSYRLAEKYGHPEFSMSVKKQELPAYDPRGQQGIGLNYATSNRGGCHVRGYMTSPEVLGIPEKVDPDSTEGKAALLKIFQDLTALVDSAGICLFTTFGQGLPEIAEQLRQATGLDLSDEEFLLAGERIWNLERSFNLQAGISSKDDTLPPRLLREPMKGGPHQGNVVRLELMLPEYYTLRGWDQAGVPTPEKLQELSL